MKRRSDDKMIAGWPQTSRQDLAQWAARWIRIAQILAIPVGLFALFVALYLAKDQIRALLR